MDSALVTSVLVMLVLLGCCIYSFRSRLIPECVAPFAQLDAAARQALVRRKRCFRMAALSLFALAALTLFTGFPRGVTLFFACGGFVCQYRVFRLRRRFPMSPCERGLPL